MNEEKIKHGSWLVTLPLMGIAACFMAFMWMPGHRTLRETRQQIEAKQQFVNQAAEMSDALTAAKKELEATQAAVAAWEKNAPQKKDLPVIYGKINALAKDAGLTVSRFDPELPVLHEQVREIPISIVCTGQFSQLHEFLRGIEQLPVSLWIENLKIDKTTEPGKDVQCNMNVVVFSNNPESSDYTSQVK